MSYNRDTTGRRIDKRTLSSKPGTKLIGFQAALANRAAAPADILVIADSIGEGIGMNTANLSQRWINQALNSLRNLYPIDGAGGFGYEAAWTSYGGSATPVTSGTTTQANNGLGHRSLMLGAGATVTFSRTCTKFSLAFKRTGTDAVTVSVDGSPTTVAAGPTGDWVYTSGTLNRGPHTIVVTQTAGAPEVEGCFYFDDDTASGIRLWDCTKAGTAAGSWTTAGGGSQAWLSAATALGLTPSLVILALGTNDAATGAANISAATYQTNMASLISVVRGKWANVPILLVGSYQSPTRQDAALVEPWKHYGDALETLALADSRIAFLDLMATFGNIASSAANVDGLLNSASLTHPSDLGHRFYAQLVVDFLRAGVADTGLRSVSSLRTDTVNLGTGWSTATSAPTIPATPARGAALSGDINGGIIVVTPFGNVINQLGIVINISTSQNPVRLAWRYMRVTTAASTVTLTLPQPKSGQRHTIKKIDSGAGTVVIACAASQTIEGASTKTLSGQWSYITLVGTDLAAGAGVGWEIEGSGGTIS